MIRRLAAAALVSGLLVPATADASPHVMFKKWSVQIARAGVVENDTHPDGAPQPTCKGDALAFAGVAGRYRDFPPGSTVSGLFLLDGHRVGTAGPYTTAAKGTFGFSWQPAQPVPIDGAHVLELRFRIGQHVVAHSRLRFTPGGAGDCG